MEAVGVLFGGAALGAVAAELLKAVLEAKEKVSNFQPMFQRLESTLKSIIPRLDAISHLNHMLKIQQNKLDELHVLVNDGKLLVLKCSQTSDINYIKKLQYGKELSDLDNSLKNYFIALLPLDHFINDLETLILVKQIHSILVRVESETDHCMEDSIYQKKSGKNSSLLLRKDCPYHDLELEDLENCRQVEELSTGGHATSYRCTTKHGDVLLKRLTLNVRVTQREFQQRMEDIGKIGQHPNILLPFGYFSSEIDKFVLYDYAPAGSLSALLKDPNKKLNTRAHWDRSLRIVLGVARGISHIHSNGGVHGNIKSSNVLLTSDFNGRISDFSLAPMINFPALNAAPELEETREATQKSDVYSFGVILSEITKLRNKHHLWHPLVFLEQADLKLSGWKCKEKNPDKRPKMDEVVRMIEDVAV